MSHHLGPVLGVSSPQVSQVANTVAAGLLTAYGLLRFTRAPRRTPITRRLVCVVELSFCSALATESEHQQPCATGGPMQMKDTDTDIVTSSLVRLSGSIWKLGRSAAVNYQSLKHLFGPGRFLQNRHRRLPGS